MKNTTKQNMNNPNLKILAIDTSCDETSVAVTQGRKVLSSVISSQVELHKKWGGVVPDIARRAHEENIGSAYQEALKRAKVNIDQIDAVAVTIGPGLAIDLEVGIQFAKDLALEKNKPLVPVNHMEGHLLSGFLLNSQGKGEAKTSPEKLFPALAMLISGKHTEIVKADRFGKYTRIGWTVDDAAGEAFDKVGRILGFGYPGGPVISQFAQNAPRKEVFGLPVPMEKSGDLNFSYSGLKTACMYKVKTLRESGRKDSEWINDFCFEFVTVVTKSILIKLNLAFDQYPECKTLLMGGGVYNNEYIVRNLKKNMKSRRIRAIIPEKRFRSDNGAMIAIAGMRGFYDGEQCTSRDDIMNVERVPRLNLG